MDRDLMLSLYRDMIRIRRFEEEAARSYTRGKMGGFLHLYIGEEAVAVGAISAVEPTDYILATYREHAHYLVRVGDMKAAMAELFGKETGCSKGRGGSMHFFEVKKRYGRPRHRWQSCADCGRHRLRVEVSWRAGRNSLFLRR